MHVGTMSGPVAVGIPHGNGVGHLVAPYLNGILSPLMLPRCRIELTVLAGHLEAQSGIHGQEAVALLGISLVASSAWRDIQHSMNVPP